MIVVEFNIAAIAGVDHFDERMPSGDHGHLLGEGLHAALPVHVDRVGADLDEALGEFADRRGIGPAVQHDRAIRAGVTNVA